MEAGEGHRPETEIAMLRSEVLQLRADKNRLEAENVQLRQELSTHNNEMFGSGGSDLMGLINGAPNNIDMNSLKGGRPRQDVNKAPLSTDGRGMQGRPPPGAAGRATREAHEKAKGFQNEVRRLEALLQGAQKAEAQAKRESAGLRTQLEQLQNIQKAEVGDSQAQTAVGQLVNSQREVDRLRGAFQKMKMEKASIVAEYGEFLNEKSELEEKVSVAERSLQQMEFHNMELQQQLRSREEELSQFTSTTSAATIQEESYPHLKSSLIT
jgi:chromosome segregation ATPase